MDPKFAVSSSTYFPGRTDLDQMPKNPTRQPHHRRAHSETFFQLPDFDDDVMAELNFDLPPQLNKAEEPKPAAHVRSLSVDADFFEGLELDAPWPPAEFSCRPSATSSELDCNSKKSMAADRLAELALIDPKRAKRIVANRQSAARSKERKTLYTNELERKVQTLQNEATTLSAQITLLQRDTTGLTAENKELELKLQAMEQQAHLRDALNEALRDEVQWLKIAAGHVPGANRNSKGPSFR